MTLRQKLGKLSLLLDISDPIELSPGVFQTKLTHPKLQGELTFVHSQAVGRDETLRALDENIVGLVLDMVNTVGGLIDATATTKKPTVSTPSSAGST